MQLSYKLTIQLDKNLSMKFKEGTTWITIGNYQCTEKQNSRLAVSYKRRKRQIRKKHKKCSVVFILIFFLFWVSIISTKIALWLKIMSAILRIENDIWTSRKDWCEVQIQTSIYLFNIISALTCIQRKIPKSSNKPK